MLLPLRILFKTILNIGLVWVLSTYFDEYFVMTGGWTAIAVLGVLITLMNMIVRPILTILTLPFKLFATILAIIIVNGAFVQIIYLLVQEMRTDIVTLEIAGGIMGWVIVACVLGIGNWLMKFIMK